MALPHGANRNVGTSAIPLTAAGLPVGYEIELKAAAGNAGKVYVGLSSSVTAGSDEGFDGWELSAGNTLAVPKSLAPTTADVWLIASQSGQVVFWRIKQTVDDSEVLWALDFSTPPSSGYMAL